MSDKNALGSVDDSRAVAAFAYGYDWTIEKAVERFGRVDIDYALAQYREALVPLRNVPDFASSDHAHRLKSAVMDLGQKVRPDYSRDQAERWTASIVLALSNLAPIVAIKAAREAIHEPFEHPGQAERIIRDKAKAIEERHRWAIERLGNLKVAIERGLPKPKKDNRPPAPPLSQAEVDRMASAPADSMSRSLFEIGLKNGAIIETEPGKYRPAPEPIEAPQD